MSEEVFDAELPPARCYQRDLEALEKIVATNKDKFSSTSHAIRCATQEFIRKWSEYDE